MDRTNKITKYCQHFLQQVGFTSVISVETRHDTEGDVYQILLQTDAPSVLIGYHGENLTAMQTLLSLHLHAVFDEWLNLSLNINDYRERRQFTLHSLADTAVSRVMATGQAHSLPPMAAAERRLVHLYLANHPHVSTASQGAGKSRFVVVSPKA